MLRKLSLLILTLMIAVPAGAEMLTLETEHARLVLDENAQTAALLDLRSEENVLNPKHEQNFCRITMSKGATSIPANRLTWNVQEQTLDVGFPNDVSVQFKYEILPDYITFEVVSVKTPENVPFYRLDFARAFGKVDYTREDAFGLSALILSIQTNVLSMPGKTNELGGSCYFELGYEHAQIAFVAVPEARMRDVMKDVTRKILDRATNDAEYRERMPAVSLAGGGFAQDIPKSYGSYIITSTAIRKEDVPAWAEHLTPFGVNQIDFHQGNPFRQGDFVFHETAYPGGVADFRKMTDALRERGMTAGFHTYAEFLAGNSRYLTPTPHPDLDTLATFTLESDLSADAPTFTVTESTENVSLVTGFGVKNSRYLWIEDEILYFDAVDARGFSKCRRGALGTKAVSHPKGAPVRHLTQMYGQFAPKVGSPLFLEVARETAKNYDAGGFGMIYLDALDGTWTIAPNRDYVWYYDALFVREILQNITTEPPLLEYSTMHASLWAARSRMGAWDSPSRGYKTFFDKHFASNDQCAGARYLPGQVGWFSLCPGAGNADPLPNFQTNNLYREDLEYFGAKTLARNCGFSYLGLSLGKLPPAVIENGKILHRFDALRGGNHFSASVLKQLLEPGRDFHLHTNATTGAPEFLPAEYEYKNLSQTENTLEVQNSYESQKPFLRVENRHSVSGYDSPEGVTLVKFDANAPASAKTEQTFETPLDLTSALGMGMWVYGDGKGQLLNVRVTSPEHLTSGATDHYARLDHVGWKYISFAEAENGAYPKVGWPGTPGGLYVEYRQRVVYSQISTVYVLVNGDTSGLRFRDLRALPIVPTTLVNPVFRLGDKEFILEGSIPNGHYVEISPEDTETTFPVLNPKGEEVGRVTLRGSVPTFASGANTLRVTLPTQPTDATPAARVTFGFFGPAI